MTRQPRAWTASALLALLAALPAAAQELAPAADVEVSVPDGPAPPTMDGRIDDAEWEGAFVFDVVRGDDRYGRGWLRRTGRQLYFAFDSKVTPWGLGLRLTVIDPNSGRKNIVLVTPVNPPGPPVAAFRDLAIAEAERVPASACDVRFVFRGHDEFSCELRLPLDLLEIAPTEATYRFLFELWALQPNRLMAAYPQDERSATPLEKPAVFKSEGAWGADKTREGAPPPNEALVLLEAVERGTKEGPTFRDAGWIDGRRRDAPLAALEARAVRAVEACPSILSSRAFLVHVRIARNDLVGALAALDEMEAFLPPFSKTPRQRILRAQILRDLQRYDEALAVVEGEEVVDVDVAREKTALEGLREAWRVEKEIRKQEALRDDLPRVRLETSKGAIVLELYEDDVPNGVANFVSLVESGLYDGTRFHSVDAGGRVVGGDPNSKDDDPHDDGYGDAGYEIESEPGRRLIFPMTVTFADKRRERRTEGSAFAIHLSPYASWDGVNTVLGRVIEGEDVARRLEYYDTLEKASVLRKRPHPYTPARR